MDQEQELDWRLRGQLNPSRTTPEQLPDAPVSPSPLRGSETVQVRVDMIDGFMEAKPNGDGGVRLVGWLHNSDGPPAVFELDRTGAAILAVTLLELVGAPVAVATPVPDRPMCPITIRDAQDRPLRCEQTSHPLEQGQACAGTTLEGEPWEYRWNATPGAGNVPAPVVTA